MSNSVRNRQLSPKWICLVGNRWCCYCNCLCVSVCCMSSCRNCNGIPEYGVLVSGWHTQNLAEMAINCHNFSPYVVDTKHIISFSLRDSRLDCHIASRARLEEKYNKIQSAQQPDNMSYKRMIAMYGLASVPHNEINILANCLN